MAIAEFERTFIGHKSWVYSVTVSPDGQWAASGSDDNTVRIWALASGECRATLEGHGFIVTSTSVAITPDGRRILSGSHDEMVRVWGLELGREGDRQGGRQLARLSGRTSTVQTVLALPDNARALSGGFDGLQLWDLAAGKCLKTIPCGTDDDDHVFSSAVDPTGTWVLSGHRDGSIRRWDLATGEQLATLTGHSGIVKSVQITSDGQFAVSGSNDKTVRIWDLAAGRCLGTLEGHHNQVHSVALSPDGSLIASTGFTDKTVRLWDRQSGACRQVIENQDNASPLSVAFAPDGARLLVGTALGSIYIYRISYSAAPPGETGRRYVNAKVVLIGEGAVGKTSLAHRLIEDKYVIRDRTHGMNVWRLELPAGRVDKAVRPHPPNDDGCASGPGGCASGPGGCASGPGGCASGPGGCASGPGGCASGPGGCASGPGGCASEPGGCAPGALIHPTQSMDDRGALLWDLAGQEDYRLIHRLFLEETALALLLINPQKDDPFAGAGDWLKALETARNQSATRGIETPQKTNRAAARLLVFSQIDVGGMKVSNAKIERFCAEHGFHGWIATSAKTGENCSDSRGDKAAGSHPSKHRWIRALQKKWRWMRVGSAVPAYPPSKLKQLIADSIPWETLPWTNTPRLLAELKNALLAMRDEAGIRLLRFAELTHRLQRALPGQEFQQSDVRTAVGLLANHGLARPLKFGDLVLLQPELLNGYAGAVIRAARAHTDEIGCVAESQIHDAAFDFTGVDRLARPDEELLLRALVQTFLDHSLCIAEDTGQGKQLVFPSQYRREKDIPWEPDIFVSYTFEGEWQTIWTTLVVRLWYSNEFEHRELWRNAAEFVSSRGQFLGLKIDNRQGEGEATISLFFHAQVPDELKVNLIGYVHRHLAKYAANVRRDRRYVCQCGKPVMDLDAVRERIENGKDFITCQKCDERVPFRDFIEERLESDSVARKILEMEKTAKRELDNQALEQILTGHVQAITGEAGQIFRELTRFDYGIDGEVEFKDNEGRASGRKIYVQLKSGNSYLRTRGGDGREVFDVKNERHLEYWVSQPVDVYLVIRQTGEERMGVRGSDEGTIRWMNVTRYLKERKDKKSRQIIFAGENLTRETVLQVRDRILGGAG